MKRNILIIVDSFYGGAGNMAQILANKLKNDRSNNVKLLLMNHANSKSRFGFDLGDENQAIYFNEKFNKFTYLFKATSFIKRIIRKNNIKYVVSFLDNNNTIAGLGLFFNKKVRLIVSERSNPVVIPPSNKVWSILRRIAYKRANVVSIQFQEFDVFDGGRFKHKCFETPNIILETNYRRKRINTPVIRFVTCARFDKIKRLDLMIELFHRINTVNPNTELIICGDGTGKGDIINLICKYHLEDKIKMIGHVNNVYQILVDCDVYLLTSHQEGFPNALSEALATGLPAVAFKCHEGMSKLVKNEYNGFLINEGDSESFVNKCLFLSYNLDILNNYGENSINIAMNYSSEKVLNIWEKIIFEDE